MAKRETKILVCDELDRFPDRLQKSPLSGSENLARDDHDSSDFMILLLFLDALASLKNIFKIN